MGSIYRDEVLRLMELKPKGGRVLDVGCHDGLFLSSLVASVKIGIDPEPIRGVTKVSLIQGDGCFLPFSDGYFDHVYALDVIEHVIEDVRFAKSLVRVLSPGGRLIVTTPSQDISVFPPFTMSLVNKKWGHTIRTGYTIKEFNQLFSGDSIFQNIKEWNAPYYRLFYFPVRAFFAIIPNATRSLIKVMARMDFEHQNGKRGFLILDAHRHK
jgi:ubiquinone/menaquinone biosynthesis C-methylase UbiE